MAKKSIFTRRGVPVSRSIKRVLVKFVAGKPLTQGRRLIFLANIDDPDFLDIKQAMVQAYKDQKKKSRTFPELGEEFFLAIESGLIDEVELELPISVHDGHTD